MHKQFNKFWTTLNAIKLTAGMSFNALYQAYQNKLTPHKVDKMVQAWSDKMCKALGASIKIHNPDQTIPMLGEPTIVLCNHASLLDIPFCFQVFRQSSIRMLAKKELRSIPFMGKAMLKAGFPFIDRRNRTQALKDLAEMNNLLKHNIVIWAFPEGTRSRSGKIQPLKKGIFISAIEMQATIIPIYIDGAFDMLGPKNWLINPNKEINIYVGQKIKASNFSLADKEDMIQNIHNWMTTKETNLAK